jgi:predicted nucleotide-binding protein (sugar kinase/HSP70/actin superfamily)
VSTETEQSQGNGHGPRERAQAILSTMPAPAALRSADTSPLVTADIDLTGRTLWLPRMPYGGSRLLAAAFQSIGFEARVTPESDGRTMELGARYTSGDECFPQKVVMGDFMKLFEDEGVDPTKTALMMPTANGPCRFGQYAALQRRILDDAGLHEVPILSLTSADGYAGIGDHARELIRTAWRAVVANDILMKLLLMTRPYEVHVGETDRVYLNSLDLVCAVIARPGVSDKERMRDLKAALHRVKEHFRAIRRRKEDRPLIGVVGEIFCRLNTYSNEQLIRRIEALGGECWLAGVGEWLWYTSEEQYRRYREEKRRVSRDWLKTTITSRIQHKDEEALLEDFHEVFLGYEDPPIREIIDLAEPYLPQSGAMGEMVLSTGGAIFFYEIGADGVVDISPFTCMNGIVTEAIYPKVSRDHDDFPIRVFYFDGTQGDLDRDVGIFLELAKTYKRRKRVCDCGCGDTGCAHEDHVSEEQAPKHRH